MPTRRPIQVDTVPPEYDSREVQRVLESVVRQLTLEEPEEKTKASAPAPAEDPHDILTWVL